MLSYIVIIPRISSNQSAYGIYSVVISLMIFLQYADLGFLGAGQKYAAESYAKNDRINEINILGFAHFILLLVVIVYAIGLGYLYFRPNAIFNNIAEEDVRLAKGLVLVFLISAPNIILQRLTTAIFSIRLEDYIQQYVDIIFSVLKIMSTFYFFRSGHYEILNYVSFIQVMNFISALVGLVIINYRYNYEFGLLFHAFRFDRIVFNKTKIMAFTSIIVTMAWMLYYELDSIYVSKLYNPKMVALFAIGITMLTFSRSLMNAFFAPFQTKFNHFRGLGDDVNLKKYFLILIEIAFPISLFPALTIICMMQPLVISWLGSAYSDSILISKILISNLFFSFLLVPINYLAMAKEKFRFIFINSLILPFCYFLFFFILYRFIDHFSLPVAKILTILINLLVSLILLKDVINHSLIKLLYRLLFYSVLPLISLVSLLYFTNSFWNIASEKNISQFLRLVGIGSIYTIVSILLYYYINPNTRLSLERLIFNKLPKYK